MKKSVFCTVFILALFLSLSACGNADQPQGSASPSVPVESVSAANETFEPSTPAPEPPASSGKTETDIAYISDGSPYHTLDIRGFERDGDKKPVVFYIHGGGLTSGDKREVSEYADYIAAHGYAVVSINYTLVPDGTIQTIVQDLVTALQWVVDNADTYQLDTENVILNGESAGGYCAATLALVLRSTALQGYYDVVPPGSDVLTVRAIGLSHPMTTLETLAQYDDIVSDDGVSAADVVADPDVMRMGDLNYLVEYAGAETVPEFYILTTQGDIQWYPGVAKLHETLTAATVPHEYVEHEGTSHRLIHVFNVKYIAWEESITANEALLAYFDSRLS